MTAQPVYFPKVAENSKPQTTVIKLEAFDADDDVDDDDTDASESDPKNAKTFEIVSGNPQSLFVIDHKTGVISTTNRMLDREAQPEHVLEVRVSDNGTPSLNSTTRVIVQVTDENDNKPEFIEKFYKVRKSDTSQPRDLVQLVSAAEGRTVAIYPSVRPLTLLRVKKTDLTRMKRCD